MIEEDELPDGWSIRSDQHSTVATPEGAYYNLTGIDVAVWSSVEEPGSYGEPEDDEIFCVELVQHKQVEGEYFATLEDAEEKALEWMDEYKDSYRDSNRSITGGE